MEKKKVAILGAGITGLAAGLYLSRKDFDVHIFERKDRIGGLVGGKIINNNVYEYGPHFFHTNNPQVLKEIKDIVGNELKNFNRTILIKFMDNYFTFPLSIFEVLKKLPRKIVARAICSFISSNFLKVFKKKRPENSETILLDFYGKVLYELFFKSYIKSVWGIGPEKFSPDFAKQRIPKASAAVFLNKILSPIRVKFSKKTSKNFVENVDGDHYTTKRGYRGIVEKIAKTIVDNGGKIHLNSEIAEIMVNDNSVRGLGIKTNNSSNNNNKALQFDGFINTLPISELIKMMVPKVPDDIINSVDFLEYRALVFVGILINKPKVLPVSFMYFRQHSFNRVYDSSYFGHDTVNPDTTILVAEISCSVGDKWWNDEEYCKKMVIDDLLRENIIEKDDILEAHAYRYRFGYPIYKLGYEEHLKKIIDFIDNIKNLETAGRQGLFQYINGHIAIQMGFKAAENLIKAIDNLE